MSDAFALDDAVSAPRALTITESAVARLRELVAVENDPKLMLRITVSGGGCSGYQYGFSFDDRTTPDDLVFERDGMRVVTDEASIGLLGGSEIDFVENLTGAYFAVNNPNATSSCGCGTSFAA